ncbi:YciI family protein [Hymenobacter aerilatus]|uniref:YciI family protein n=1 Tax=Hymenobacter aerilatus TaxID=2932251 RepID=A0A8T9SRT9_9BACT|nr:YciI family protein [Hymenobacter aerilatus]UOR04457.1 YciI family protein [Hymenobacter aerilatus]
MFLLSLTYLVPFEEIEPLMAPHMTWVDTHYQNGTFLLSGRKVPRTGGILLARAASREAIEAIVAADPFTQADAVRYDIIEFTPTRVAPGANEAWLD